MEGAGRIREERPAAGVGTDARSLVRGKAELVDQALREDLRVGAKRLALQLALPIDHRLEIADLERRRAVFAQPAPPVEDRSKDVEGDQLDGHEKTISPLQLG